MKNGFFRIDKLFPLIIFQFPIDILNTIQPQKYNHQFLTALYFAPIRYTKKIGQI